MANRSNTGGSRSAPKKRPTQKTAAKSGGSRKKKNNSRAVATQTGRLGSVFIFALALLLAALTYLPGQAVWSAVRDACFGLFGWGLYLAAPALLYMAVVMVAGQRRGHKLALCALILPLACGIGLVFSGYQPPQEGSFWQMVKDLYALGSQRQGGGVFAVPLGLSLLCWAGRPAANILLLILLVVLVMFLADVTPADIMHFLGHKAGQARAYADEALVERDARRQQRQARAATRAEAAAARPRRRPRVDPQLPPETLDKPRDRWDIDVQLTEDVQMHPATAEDAAPPPPLESAKGAAFDPADHSDLADVLDHDLLAAAGRQGLHPAPAPTPAPEEEPFISEMVPVPPTQPERLPFDQDRPTPPRPLTEAPQRGTSRSILQLFTQAAEAERATAQTGAAQNGDGPLPGGQDARLADAPKPGTDAAPQADDGMITPPANGSADKGGDGEIDSLIRRALDGRPPMEDATRPDAAPNGPTGVAAPLFMPPTYHLPSPELLDRQPGADQGNVNAEMRHNAQVLVGTLESFGVKTKILDICRGPSVTRYELQPLAGVKISRITNLADDIALNLASAGVRIEAPIPGKPAVGIEVPNKTKTTVALRSLIQSEDFEDSASPLTMCLGRDIAGSVKLADLAKMPHLLIAGSTGSGKSVCINSIIMSFLYKATPDDLRMILIDPKVVELAEYNSIPHLLMPVVTEPRKAAGALGSAVSEMERRYQLFAAHNVRNIKSYNQLAEGMPELDHLPYIAIIIDELADLMMVCGKEVEDYICRIAQKARACGMHLIVATQRPSVDVITGLIKANIPSRIAFAVSSQVDSRTILDSAGAEKLLGMGDMLFLPVGASKPVRIQGTFVKDSEIERVIEEVKSYADSRYDEEMIAETDRRAAAAEKGGEKGGHNNDDEEDRQEVDPLLPQALELVIDAGMASVSTLQRRLRVGYARAGRIMDDMEDLHYVGPSMGSKPREVLITRDQFLEMEMNGTLCKGAGPE